MNDPFGYTGKYEHLGIVHHGESIERVFNGVRYTFWDPDLGRETSVTYTWREWNDLLLGDGGRQ